MLKKLGLIVNPIAGVGGRVGLKGSDGMEIVKKAFAMGAELVAPRRAAELLAALIPIKQKFSLITYPREMGEDEAREVGFDPVVVGKIIPRQTTAEDTKRAAREMRDLGVDLILVVGGDGTIRDTYDVLGTDMPILGIPAGVKMHSAVFAADPRAAAESVMKFMWDELPLCEAEVMDIDEEAYRSGRLSAKLYGYMLVPYEPGLMQGMKLASLEAQAEVGQQEAIAKHVVEAMEPGVVYLLGPGTTTRAVAEALGEKKTLLGVDIIRDRKIVVRDANERQILEQLGGEARIIVSPIGGQGFIFGRGNQQISPKVVKKVGNENILVIATPQKLSSTPTLKVDTGDAKLDEVFRGYIKVITGYHQSRMVKVI
ncbi:MAG: ATP-NAD kinase [Hadesarchaea archaeon CG08_land_8_20_14_0_20_51_8]|nr:MAG: ATP-NAD kinase [Hadesarchaea archaeon CG08_land_8_20_14_0_20_51_8]